MEAPTVKSLSDDFRALGIRSGDAVFFRADLFAVSRSPQIMSYFIEAALDAVGTDGTIVNSTFTPGGNLDRLDKTVPFDLDRPSTSGALARLFLQHPDVVRSSHPINSFAAIGRNADYICGEHDETKPPFWPMGRMIELGAKQAIVGCVDTSPGFTTVHWAQHTLDLASQMRKKNRYGAYFKKDDQVKLFIAAERGGCNLGFGKFYADYDAKGVSTWGKVGNADSVCMEMKAAFEIEVDILKRNPRFALCDDPYCTKCRTMWTYNRRDLPMFLLRTKLGRLLRRPKSRS